MDPKISRALFVGVVVVSLGFTSPISSLLPYDSQLEVTLPHLSKAAPTYKKGFSQGYYDAIEGFKNRYGRNKLARRTPYEKGYSEDIVMELFIPSNLICS